MTRKNFELIASVIRNQYQPHNDSETLRRVAFDMADALADTNPAFDRSRFLFACGVN